MKISLGSSIRLASERVQIKKSCWIKRNSFQNNLYSIYSLMMFEPKTLKLYTERQFEWMTKFRCSLAHTSSRCSGLVLMRMEASLSSQLFPMALKSSLSYNYSLPPPFQKPSLVFTLPLSAPNPIRRALHLVYLFYYFHPFPSVPSPLILPSFLL